MIEDPAVRHGARSGGALAQTTQAGDLHAVITAPTRRLSRRGPRVPGRSRQEDSSTDTSRPRLAPGEISRDPGAKRTAGASGTRSSTSPARPLGDRFGWPRSPAVQRARAAGPGSGSQTWARCRSGRGRRGAAAGQRLDGRAPAAAARAAGADEARRATAGRGPDYRRHFARSSRARVAAAAWRV